MIRKFIQTLVNPVHSVQRTVPVTEKLISVADTLHHLHHHHIRAEKLYLVARLPLDLVEQPGRDVELHLLVIVIGQIIKSLTPTLLIIPG